MQTIKLDAAKLYGFKIETQAKTAKLGDKASAKLGSKLGGKLGGKVGLKARR